MKWTCKDGRVLDIHDMTKDHLRNAVRMIRRKGGVTFDEFEACGATMCSLNGEFAQMAAENEFALMFPSRALEKMESELRSRR